MGAEILELAAEPQFDVGGVADLALQRRLQIGPMHDPIGRVFFEGPGVGKRNAGYLTAASRAHQADGLGRHGAGGKPSPQAEVNQHAAGIG